MATLALPGFTAKLFVATLGDSVFVAIGELRDVTLDIEHENIDATSHDSLEFREFIRGLRNWSISAGVLHITGDVEQTTLRAAILSGIAVDVELREELAAGKPEWQGSAFVSGLSLNFPNDDAMTGDFTLQGTGVLTEAVVV